MEGSWFYKALLILNQSYVSLLCYKQVTLIQSNTILSQTNGKKQQQGEEEEKAYKTGVRFFSSSFFNIPKKWRRKIFKKMDHDIRKSKNCVSIILTFASNEVKGHSLVKAT